MTPLCYAPLFVLAVLALAWVGATLICWFRVMED